MADAHVEAVKAGLDTSGTSQPPSKAFDDLPTRLQKGFQEKLSYTNALYQEYPLITTFIVVFAGLSAIPVLTFCGTSVFILSTFLLFSTGFALCSALAIIFISGLALLACLAFILTTTVLVVGTVSGIYITARLAFHIRSQLAVEENGGGIINAIVNGLKFWFEELRNTVLREFQFFVGAHSVSTAPEEIFDEDNSAEEDVKPVLSVENEE